MCRFQRHIGARRKRDDGSLECIDVSAERRAGFELCVFRKIITDLIDGDAWRLNDVDPVFVALRITGNDVVPQVLHDSAPVCANHQSPEPPRVVFVGPQRERFILECLMILA